MPLPLSLETLRALFRESIDCRDEILYPSREDPDQRAARTWSPLARDNPVAAAAASPSADPMVKFPSWVRQHFDDGIENLLDAGCGYGRLSIPLLEEHPRLTVLGIDASDVMLAGFRRLARERGVSERVLLYCGNLVRLPLEDGCFDAALSSAVLLHLPYPEVESVVGELHRVLKRGGKLVLAGSFPNLYTPEGLQNFLYARLRPAANGPVRPYTRRQVEKLVTRFRSFDILVHGLTVFPRSLASMSLPFGDAFQEYNRRMTDRHLARFSSRQLFVSHYDVVAVK